VKRALVFGVPVVLVVVVLGVWQGPRFLRSRALHAAEATWTACGLRDYTWVQTAGAFMVGTEPVEIRVRDGQAVAASIRGVQTPLGRLSGHPQTVDELFRWMLDWVGSQTFEATYDPTCGYPVEVFVDRQDNASDDSYRISVTSLQAT
jgi:hypothetical protein